MKTIYYINEQHKNKQTFDYINDQVKKNDGDYKIVDPNYVYVGGVIFFIKIVISYLLSVFILCIIFSSTNSPPVQSCRLRG